MDLYLYTVITLTVQTLSCGLCLLATWCKLLGIIAVYVLLNAKNSE